MKVFIVVAALLLVTVFTVGTANAAPAIPKSATTTTNVCIVYSIDGIYSGGIGVHAPETVSFKSQDSFYFLWLPGQDRLRVDTLGISPLPPDEICVGIV